MFVDKVGFLGQQIQNCTSTFAIFPVSFAWDEGLFSIGFSNYLCFQECFGVGFWMWTSSRDAWWKIGTSCQPGGGLQFFLLAVFKLLWKLYYYKYLKTNKWRVSYWTKIHSEAFRFKHFFHLGKISYPSPQVVQPKPEAARIRVGLTMSLTGNLSDDRMNWHVLQALKDWSSQISTKPVTWVGKKSPFLLLP